MDEDKDLKDLEDLGKFLIREFPRVSSEAGETDRIVDTAMELLGEMKDALEAYGITPEKGW